MPDPAEQLHQNFRSRVTAGDLPEPVKQLKLADSGMAGTELEGTELEGIALAGVELVDLFESQLMSRQLDITSRRLRARSESHYTIGSAGHEGNAVFGKTFRLTDMAFLHYRSGAMLIQRSKQLPGQTPLFDMLLSFVASSEDPISGGRHKVMGSVALMVPPQTSTIASHLPKSMGAAHAIGLAQRLGKQDSVMPHDSVIFCSFGDASANHSTTQGAINAAGWASFQKSPMPIVFVCEDNGIGISVPTPTGWIAENFSRRAGLEYLYCDGLNLLDTYHTAIKAVNIARVHRRPVFLHMKLIRLMGHAGSDAEVGYRSAREIEAIEAQDPLLHSARLILEEGLMTPEEIVSLHGQIEARVTRIAEHAITRPKLTSVKQVMSALIPPVPAPVGATTHEGFKLAEEEQRARLFKGEERQLKSPQHLARLINLTLADLMLQHPDLVLLGEDVGRKGGVYGVTAGLQKKFGRARVLDTLLDEQSILGLALGMAHNGFIPMPEIQFLAYVHNAEDQIRGEAATLPFFSNGQFTNPMLIRIAGLAYQKGFGGHFHNDNSFAVFRDIPGVILACPSNGRDAQWMLRSCVEMCTFERRVVIFLEPIALYMTRDLHAEGDGLWLSEYEPPIADRSTMPLGEVGVRGEGNDLCILTYGNGFYLSCQAEPSLIAAGLNVRIVDLRWLAPLSEAAIIAEAGACEHVLIVDECRKTGSVSEALMTLLMENQITVPCARVTAEDSFIPIGEASTITLPDKQQIVTAALELTGIGNG